MSGFLRAAVVSSLILAGAASAHAGEPLPEELLKEKGLFRAKTYFVVPSETGVIQNFTSKVRPTIVYMSRAHAKLAKVLENEAMLQWSLEYKDQLVAEINNVNLALPNMRQSSDYEKAQKAQAQRYLNSLLAEQNSNFNVINTLRARQVPVREKVRLEKEFEKEREKFLKAKEQLFELLTATTDEYDKLKQDDEVKNAINAFRIKTKAHLPLGPSKDLNSAIKVVKDAERNYSPETAAPSQKKKPKTLRG